MTTLDLLLRVFVIYLSLQDITYHGMAIWRVDECRRSLPVEEKWWSASAKRHNFSNLQETCVTFLLLGNRRYHKAFGTVAFSVNVRELLEELWMILTLVIVFPNCFRSED